MDLDDARPLGQEDPLDAVTAQDLSPLSVDELNERIRRLKAEITRIEDILATKDVGRAAAEAVFRKL